MSPRLLALLLIGAAALSAACKPIEKPVENVPLTGQVKLEFSGTDGKYLFFNLDNGTHETLGLSGAREDGSILPQISSISCVSLRESGGNWAGGSIIDGPRWEIIQVPSGTRLRLSIWESTNKVFESARCNFQVGLQDGTSIESPQFEVSGEADANRCVSEATGGIIAGSCAVALAKAEIERRQGTQTYTYLSGKYSSNEGIWLVMATRSSNEFDDFLFVRVSKDGKIVGYRQGR